MTEEQTNGQTQRDKERQSLEDGQTDRRTGTEQTDRTDEQMEQTNYWTDK